MKLKTILASTLAVSALAGCVKHEIIPAPEPKVELVCHFTGNIAGTDLELTQNVQGYYLETGKSKVVPPSGPSRAIYYSEMKSAEALQSIKINLGEVLWDSGTSSDPTTTIFNGFMSATKMPDAPGISPVVYTAGAVLPPSPAKAGFEVVYRDASGILWTSKETDPNTIEFSNIVQESDKTGDYSKFVAKFDCVVYHTFMTIDNTVTPPDTTYDEQSRLVEDAVFKGWFKR